VAHSLGVVDGATGVVRPPRSVVDGALGVVDTSSAKGNTAGMSGARAVGDFISAHITEAICV
jgi:hypothetical protein